MICVCLRGTSLSEWSKELAANSAYADMLELRFDCLEKTEQNLSNLKSWLRDCKLPCIFTIRESEDGGNWTGTEEEKDKIIAEVLQSGLLYAIDIEAARHSGDGGGGGDGRSSGAHGSSGARREETRRSSGGAHGGSGARIESNGGARPEETRPSSGGARRVFDLIQKHALDTRIIVSEHRFEPDRTQNTEFLEKKFAKRVRELAEQHPDAVIKYAVQCHSSNDFLSFLRASKSITKDSRDYVLIPMGDFGQAARILPGLGVSVWTYCSATDSPSGTLGSRGLGPHAPLGQTGATESSSSHTLGSHAPLGQLSAKTLHCQYRYHELQGHELQGRNRMPPVFAVIGNPVMHSRSPSFFNAHFAEQNILASYIHLPVDDLTALPELVEQLNIQGMSVTIPHKEGVLSFLQKKNDTVRSCSAANTVLCKKTAWEGHNTDVLGFLLPLMKKLDLGTQSANTASTHANTASTSASTQTQSTDLATYRNSLLGKRCTLLGAGGAARAILFALCYCGATILIANRSKERAESLARLFPEIEIQTTSLDDYEKIVTYNDIIVNSTSMGMKSSETPLPRFPFKKNHLVYDIVYTPPITKLLADARQAGATIITGDSMFHTQASLQADLFVRQIEKPL